MILQKKCTFHPPACILVRFILAHSFRLTEKERSNVTAKYTKTPLWILLREKRNTQNPNTDPCVREREISLNQIWPNCSSKQGNTETVTFLWCWCVTAIITNLFCCTATFLLLLQLLMPLTRENSTGTIYVLCLNHCLFSLLTNAMMKNSTGNQKRTIIWFFSPNLIFAC